MIVIPVTLKAANEIVAKLHRHHKTVPGAKFSIAVQDETGIRGVAICGRPVARMLDDGKTLEVNRCCTDGARNACSMLYRAAWRAGSAMGYTRMITYTLPEEGGASLRGAGFVLVGEAGGGEWSRPSRGRKDAQQSQRKLKWQITSTAK